MKDLKSCNCKDHKFKKRKRFAIRKMKLLIGLKNVYKMNLNQRNGKLFKNQIYSIKEYKILARKAAF
jgi:hypothetical protein